MNSYSLRKKYPHLSEEYLDCLSKNTCVICKNKAMQHGIVITGVVFSLLGHGYRHFTEKLPMCDSRKCREKRLCLNREKLDHKQGSGKSLEEDFNF